MAAVTICSDFEAQENKICQEPLFPLRSLHFSSKSLTISRIVKSISRSPFCMVLGAPKVGSTPWILEYKILLVLKKTQSRPLPQATVFPSSAHFEDLPHIHAWWVGQPWLSYLWKRNLLTGGLVWFQNTYSQLHSHPVGLVLVRVQNSRTTVGIGTSFSNVLLPTATSGLVLCARRGYIGITISIKIKLPWWITDIQ